MPKLMSRSPKPNLTSQSRKPKLTPEARSQGRQPKPEAKADQPKPEAKDKTQPDVTPQLVKRVHELYEQLGREDVQTVQDWEKANPELQKTESHK
jgi:H+-transporting ATPase